MYLKRLTCTGFRCLKDILFEPSPGLNVIHGDNAQGKTSILEALLFAVTSKSHRTTTESELVAYQAEGFHIAAEAARADRDVLVEANWWRGAKRFKVNGVAQTRVSDILGKITVTFFSPEDISLVKAGASVRRKFMDMELSQLNPQYLAALQKYRQILRQRNELLRTKDPAPDLLAAWDTQLAQHGALLIAERRTFVEELAELAQVAYAQIAHNEPLRMNYKPDVEPDADFAAILEKTRKTDLQRKMTTRGPHRDDIQLSIDNHPARSTASQGQQKSAALAIKLAELNLIHRRTGEYPILMLDEVLAELDQHRASHLFSAIEKGVQCLLTTAGNSKDHPLTKQAVSTFHIKKGHLTKL